MSNNHGCKLKIQDHKIIVLFAMLSFIYANLKKEVKK
ncbi:hypothetical protein J3E06_001420 [Methanococcus voltae]|uniref:Uncharacterized protein n=1 Tax=Methanococcus voltae (strain ATCC BAA-1334 / A3) TaxID=456320 RepID=D7DSK2_METV3|nr:hypothetical protein [Methanococcus voltae]